MSYELNITELKEALEIAKQLDKPVLVLGSSGVGKSQAIQQFAKQFKDGMIDIRLSQMDAVDLCGVPVPTMVDGKLRSVFTTPNMFPTDPNFEGLINLEEISQANAMVQSAAFQLVLDRQLNDYVVPKGAMIVACGNEAEHGGAANDILAPLLSRFFVIRVKPSLEQWIEDYAPYNNVHPVVVQYLKANPDEFFTYEKKSNESNKSFANARGWKEVSDLLHLADKKGGFSKVGKAMVAGKVGDEIVEGLAAMYLDLNCLPEINLILEGRLKEFEFQNASYIFASAYAGLAKILSTIKEDDVEVVSKKVANYVNFFLDNKNVGHNTDLCVGMVVKLMKKTTEISSSIYQHITNECKDIMGAVEEYKQLLAA